MLEKVEEPEPAVEEPIEPEPAPTPSPKPSPAPEVNAGSTYFTVQVLSSSTADAAQAIVGLSQTP